MSCPPPPRKTTNPNCPPPKNTTLRQFTESRQKGCNWKIWEICSFMGKHSILWPCPRKLFSKRNTVFLPPPPKKPINRTLQSALSSLRNEHPKTHSLPNPKSLFFCFFQITKVETTKMMECLSKWMWPTKTTVTTLILKSKQVTYDLPKEAIFRPLHTPHQSRPPPSQTTVL